MELDAFLRNVVRRWYILVALVGAAVFGTWLYHDLTGESKATALVAVLRPYAPAPGEYAPAQLTFEALDESNELAARVATRLGDGTSPEQVKSKTTIDIRISTKPTLTPLYEVSFEDPDPQRAKLVANIVLEEAKVLYLEINRPEARDVRAAFAPELTRLEGVAAAARGELTRFEVDNDAYNLTAKRDQTRGFVNQLRLLHWQLDSGRVSASGLEEGPVLEAARRELDRLTALEGDYSTLKTEVELAQSEMFRLESRVQDLQTAAPVGSAVTPYLREAQNQLSSAKMRFTTAQEALTTFQQQNGVSDVTGSRQAQLALVNQLTLSETSTRSGISSIGAALAREEAELQRLEGLAPTYDALILDLRRAETQLSVVEQRVLDIIGGQTLPTEAQVLVLDNAKLQSNLLWLITTYGLGVIVALFMGLTIIYLVAVFERVPLTVRQIESALGLPVLAQIPRASQDEV